MSGRVGGEDGRPFPLSRLAAIRFLSSPMPIHRKNHWRERVALRELAERELEFWRDWLGMLAIPDLRREYRRWEIDPRPKNGERKDAATRSRSSALQKASGTGGVGEHACNSTP